MSNTTSETPLLDLLKSVPADARMIYEHSPIESSSIPVGVLAKRAADALTAQAATIAEQARMKRQAPNHFPDVKEMVGGDAEQFEWMDVEAEDDEPEGEQE